jgi:predicted DNA binding CopG/RHH family protein
MSTKTKPHFGRAGSGLGGNPSVLIDEGEFKMTQEEEARAEAAIAQADSERPPAHGSIAATETEDNIARVSFRWENKQVDMVKRAAELAGVPYQTYVKLVLYRQAAADVAAWRDMAIG